MLYNEDDFVYFFLPTSVYNFRRHFIGHKNSYRRGITKYIDILRTFNDSFRIYHQSIQ